MSTTFFSRVPSSTSTLAARTTSRFPSPTSTRSVGAENLPPNVLRAMCTALVIIGLVYVCALRLAYKRARLHPKVITTFAGLSVQRFAPILYIFVIICAFAETAVATFLFVQYHIHENYPSVPVRNAIGVLLCIAAGTTAIAALSSILFLHNSWSNLRVSSVGTHLVWILIAMIVWAVGALLVFLSLPQLRKDGCAGVMYCNQLRTLLYIAIAEVAALGLGTFTMFWLAYQALLRAR